MGAVVTYVKMDTTQGLIQMPVLRDFSWNSINMSQVNNEIQKLVTDWYSQPSVWNANSATYPKRPDYIDCRLLDVPTMVTNKRVLDLGCCYPSDALQFGETAMWWFSIDISPEIIKRCKALVHKPNVFFYVADMRNLPWPKLYFDTVLDFSSGDHLTEEDYKLALKEIWRVLTFNGYFVLTFANLDSFPEREYYGDFGYFRATDTKEMKRWVEDVGFTVIREEIEGDRIGLVAVKDWI